MILSEISFKGISFGKLSPVHLLKQHFELFRVLSDFFCKIIIPASLARTVPEPFPTNPLGLTPGAMQDKHSKRKARVSGPLRGLFKFKNKIEIKVHADYNNSCKLQKNRVFYNKIKYRTFFFRRSAGRRCWLLPGGKPYCIFAFFKINISKIPEYPFGQIPLYCKHFPQLLFT